MKMACISLYMMNKMSSFSCPNIGDLLSEIRCKCLRNDVGVWEQNGFNFLFLQWLTTGEYDILLLQDGP